ncbi:YgjV family protein [Parasporobacterium paucivorans]|uniref:Inner membrane protein n=1 Tax=Parasporobacterium paucivorans DSM 15970 TaxID=1122934 RepID=A0A1M6FS24_9FIRM|nr:YgjV family protein [Parasporobacterium paucivorans]SHJ00486.1 inner membrane protein [Parasporobacterium paucivorans DSM 15970]
MIYVISQIFSTLALIIFCLSMWQKDRTRLIKLQCIEPAAQIVAQVLLGGWSGVYANAVSLLRNFLCLKGVRNVINFAFIGIAFTWFLLFIDHSLISMFPVFASVVYSIGLLRGKTVTSIAAISILTSLFWLVYNIYLINIAAIINNIITLTNTFMVIYRNRKPAASKKQDMTPDTEQGCMS